MSQPPPAQDNAASWRQVRASIEAEPEGGKTLPWKRMALAALTELEGDGLDGLFRVARNGDRLVFSLAEAEGPARASWVGLAFLPEDQSVKVAYGRGSGEGEAPLIEAWVSAAVAGQVTRGGLRRLWTETRAGAPMPEELLRA